MGKIGNYAFGTIFGGIGLAIGVFTLVSSSSELEPLETLEPLDAARLFSLEKGVPVLVEARLDGNHEHLVANLVGGCHQEYVYDDDGGGDWSHRSDFTQPFYVRYGKARVALENVSGCPRGAYGIFEDQQNDERRAIGYRNGDPITAVGTVSAVDPVRIDVGRHYLGTVEGYASMLKSVRVMGPVFGGIFFLIGVGVVVHTRRKYASEDANA